VSTLLNGIGCVVCVNKCARKEQSSQAVDRFIQKITEHTNTIRKAATTLNVYARNTGRPPINWYIKLIDEDSARLLHVFNIATDISKEIQASIVHASCVEKDVFSLQNSVLAYISEHIFCLCKDSSLEIDTITLCDALCSV